MPIRVGREEFDASADALDAVIAAIDTRAGMYYGCDYECEPVYRAEARAFVDPSVRIALAGASATLEPLDAIGRAIVAAWAVDLSGAWRDDRFVVTLVPPAACGAPHPFVTLMRGLAATFVGAPSDFGFYGALNFDHWRLREANADDASIRAIFYLPLELLRVRAGHVRRVHFTLAGVDASGGAARRVVDRACEAVPARDDFAPGGYAERLAGVIGRIRAGEVMSITLSQGFRRAFAGDAAPAFRTLRARYPMPEMFFVNFGAGERLLGASPDLQVRLSGDRVECAPVCGTLPRGADAMADLAAGRELLGSTKEGAALALCADSFADSLAPLCVPGTLHAAIRQRVHFFGSVVHAADHLVGRLAPGHDAWDLLLATAAPPTVTGVPKATALEIIAAAEGSPRGWFGGAVGYLGADGSLATGTIMRQAWFHDGLAEFRAGGVIVAESKPAAEEAESQTKARKLMQLLGVGEAGPATAAPADAPRLAPTRVRLHAPGDPFVGALGDLLRACGCTIANDAQAAGDTVEVVAGVRHCALDSTAVDRLLAGPSPTLLIGGPAADVASRLGVAVERLAVARDGYVVQGLAEARGPLASIGRFEAGLYANWRIGSASAAPIEPLAHDDAGALLAYRVTGRPVAGILFRPESVLSAGGATGRRAVEALLQAITNASR